MTKLPQRIAVIATLDTKRDETLYLCDAITRRGASALIVDTSLGPSLGTDVSVWIDQTHFTKSGAGVPLTGGEQSKTQAMERVVAAAAERIQRGLDEGEVTAVIGLGGGTGSWMARRIMAGLDSDFAKVLLTTTPGLEPRADIIEIPTIVDVSGLNPLLTSALDTGAAVVCAVGVNRPESPRLHSGLVAQSMFGVNTPGGTLAREALEGMGHSVAVFHSNGKGGRDLERLIRRGAFEAVLDWSLNEVANDMFGGLCSAGPDRLAAGSESGTPYVFVPGAIDVLNVQADRARALEAEGRTIFWHMPNVALLRTNLEENLQIAQELAQRINSYHADVSIVIPRAGFSRLSVEGGPFSEPQIDEAFIHRFTELLRQDAVLVDANINDASVAAIAAKQLNDLMIARRAH